MFGNSKHKLPKQQPYNSTIPNIMSRLSSLLKEISQITSERTTATDRYTFFPIKDDNAYVHFKTQEAALWNSNEMDFSRDKKDYDNLPPKLARMIDVIYAFFAGADGIVVDNIVFRFLIDSSTLEEKAYYIVQLYIELVHSETYSLTINTLKPNEKERNDLFRAIETLPCVAKKAKWMEKYMYSDLPRSHRLLAFACAEGIFFQSSFLGVFWFRSRGILQNIIFSNEQISKDEGSHTRNAIDRYNRERSLGNEVPTDEMAIRIVTEALEIEHEFVDYLLPEAIDDLTPHGFHSFVDVLGDYLLSSCKHPVIGKSTSDDLPTWIQEISNEQKNNFYEVRVGAYKQFSLSKALDWKSRISGEEQTNTEAVYEDPTSVDF